jgi:hypothetical protein
LLLLLQLWKLHTFLLVVQMLLLSRRSAFILCLLVGSLLGICLQTWLCKGCLCFR